MVVCGLSFGGVLRNEVDIDVENLRTYRFNAPDSAFFLRLAQRYHPDKVRNRGYSGEVMLMYQRKFEAITDAWNKVKEQRGI